MSTRQDLTHNTKAEIRRITKGRTWSINIPLNFIKNLKDSDYLSGYIDSKNRLVFEPVKVENEGQ